MTTIDKTGASDAEFRARVAAFDAAQVPSECDPERVETVARAMYDQAGDEAPSWRPRWADLPEDRQGTWLRLAVAAIAADPSPAEHGPGKCVSAEDANRVLAETRDAMIEALRAALTSSAPAQVTERGEPNV